MSASPRHSSSFQPSALSHATTRVAIQYPIAHRPSRSFSLVGEAREPPLRAQGSNMGRPQPGSLPLSGQRHMRMAAGVASLPDQSSRVHYTVVLAHSPPRPYVLAGRVGSRADPTATGIANGETPAQPTAVTGPKPHADDRRCHQRGCPARYTTIPPSTPRSDGRGCYQRRRLRPSHNCSRDVPTRTRFTHRRARRGGNRDRGRFRSCL